MEQKTHLIFHTNGGDDDDDDDDDEQIKDNDLDIWLAVHHSITFLLLPNFLFIHANYIKLNSSTCFESNPPIIRRSMTQIAHMQPLVLSLAQSDDTRGCIYTITT
jgi:hypothetical protein